MSVKVYTLIVDGYEAKEQFVKQSDFDKLEAKLKIAIDALEYYANHESVIDSVTQDDKKNIQVVHTFISNRAIVTLKQLEET